ncbi:flagellar biosynthesis protein FlhF [Rhodopirellula bahusiensis]|uniref:Flagellar biosynthesis protein FlhF n=1 Tax=Rhodopirellula bahusiensis TaxID=2014065 RepID=A0A2G1W9Z2_9BACT|nr:flagellar biosynthesis protein FlhF [Rhodopirellula bahusiensis]PHQ35469.1 flagellar biosynthesis protein FlhF [Rhodopirellula bahusiensis]
MHIRTFRAANLQAALADIRNQMGPEASVLHTRQVRNGWMGWLGRTHVEVTAGLHGGSVDGSSRDAAGGRIPANYGDEPLPPADVRSVNSVAASSGYGTSPTGTPSNAAGSMSVSAGQNSAEANYQNYDAAHQLQSGTGAGQGGFYGSGYSSDELSPADSLSLRLVQAGVEEATARRWMASASSFAAGIANSDPAAQTDRRWMEHLQRAVARELNLCGPIRTQPGDRHVVALVGPTGVGKTTTVAKLAAGFRIEARRRVGLLTIDTYRIAAVQQLKAYAEIMDLPMQVVEKPEQMETALSALGDVDLVLIDTAGRSPRSDARIEQLSEFLRAAHPDETHLVLSATSSGENIRTTLEGFAPVRANAVTLTKLDETPCMAAVLAALTGRDRIVAPPLSYLTNGQQVPDDIAVADAAGLVAQLLPHMPTAGLGEMGIETMDGYESLHYGEAA